MLNGCFHVHVDEDEDDERITVRSDEEMAAMFQAVSSLSYELNFNQIYSCEVNVCPPAIYYLKLVQNAVLNPCNNCLSQASTGTHN